MRYTAIILLFLASFTVKAQERITFNHLSIENGLSQSAVLGIAQDAKGFMWFGTRFGLNKYDTRAFKIYKNDPADTTSISSSAYISSFLSARDGSFWIGTPNGLNLYQEKTDNFLRFKYQPGNKRSISHSKINCIYQDQTGRIWIGTKQGLNLSVAGKRGQFLRFLSSGKQATEIFSITSDHLGNLWLGTSEGLARLVLGNRKARLSYFRTFNSQLARFNDNHITSMVEDRNQNLWIGTKQSGMSKLNLHTGKFSTYQYSSNLKNSLSSNNIRKILLDEHGKLWIGTLHGLNIYTPETGQISSWQTEPENPASLSQNSIYDIFQDRQGSIWIGTYYGGINVVYPDFTPFTVYQSKKDKNSLSSNVTGTIIEDKHHNLWIGTEGDGLNYFNRASNTFSRYQFSPKKPDGLSSNLVKSVFEDHKGRIWVGTHLGGLNLFDPATQTFRIFKNEKDNPNSISSDEISAVFQDTYGRYWIGTTNGLNRFDPDHSRFQRNALNGLSDAVSCIYEDRQRNVWVASFSGLFVLRPGAGKFQSYYSERADQLPFGSVSCITADKKGKLWLGFFHEGLAGFDSRTGQVKRYFRQNGLPSDNITSVQEDDHGHLWIGTDNGLCRFTPAKGSFLTYNIKDGLPGNDFNYNSILKDHEGRFFAGTLHGMISFMPSQIRENTAVPNAIFTDLKLFNKPVPLNGGGGLLTANISTAPQVVFNARQNVFSVDFTLLNYIRSDKNTYAYKLEGFEQNWNEVNIPSAQYTNLSPGTYTLLVKGRNNDGFWTAAPTRLSIKVLPPFYRSLWAYLFYLLSFSIILALVIRYILMRAVLKKEKEINEQKLEFFTQISHEIRTPLTLIIGPLEKLLETAKGNAVLNRHLHPIKNNADRLMRLVTELLDFRKAESGKMNLQVSPGNIVKFSREIFLAFQHLAASNRISYHFESAEEEIEIYFDKIQLEKVLFNLLSNAFKFTPADGMITLSLLNSEKDILISVSDNGTGIPEARQDKIFSEFYQAGPAHMTGTGLGLMLSRHIVTLHQGQIRFTSRTRTEGHDGFTVFSFTLQKGKTHFGTTELMPDYLYDDDAAHYPNVPPKLEESISPPAQGQYQEPLSQQKTHTLLIVEDNAEIRQFIANSLFEEYNILSAENGAEGWELAIEQIPDLIISDVMMPVMDGLELCRKLKNDERTNHIPVILLTARSAYIHQVNGYESGADTYIMKPFTPKILKVNISNHLNLREKLKLKFARVVMLEPKNVTIDTADETFIHKVMDLIEQHMSDPDFDVPFLASQIGMSQPVLYKKIRALTDLSVNDFIKSIRLKKAEQLVRLNKETIAGIAYSVGFSDRKYFSLEFKKQYGKSPKDYAGSVAPSKQGE